MQELTHSTTVLAAEHRTHDNFVGSFSEAVAVCCIAGCVCWVAVDGELAGLVVIADTVREEASEGIRQLEGQGLLCVMLTGDNQGMRFLLCHVL